MVVRLGKLLAGMRPARRTRDAVLLARIDRCSQLLNARSQPNLNALTELVRHIEPVSLNIKQMGYDLARRLAAALPPPTDTEARHVGLASKLSTQADIESDWVAHWCGALRIPVVYHRKIWELGYVLQAIHEGGGMREGARGLGFGCGTEPIGSFLAARGVSVLATDLAASEAASIGWAASDQHTDHLDKAYHAHLVDRATFDRLVRLRFIDMNAIPNDLRDFDFCWSVCAFEHLGSIERGLRFVENAMRTLRPGGIAVHTTEYNIREDGRTIDNWPTVLFQRRHVVALARRLEAQGHEVAPFDFDLGDGPMDRFIDLPPYHYDLPQLMSDWLGNPAHLKVAIDGFAATCFGIVVRKGGG